MPDLISQKAAFGVSQLDAPCVIDGTMNRATFDTYAESQLARTLGKRNVVILDELSSYKNSRAVEILKDRGENLR